jgi:large subunit ribosomal protein L15
MLNRLQAPKGRKKGRRVGRGVGSGRGKTSGRGSKGLFSRSGGKLRHGFEGGQMPLIRRVPKRGFTGRRDNIYQVVNLGALEAVKNKEAISPETLKEDGLIKKADRLVKILGAGEIDKPVTVTAHAFSASAKAKIEKAGGKAEIVRAQSESGKPQTTSGKKEPRQKKETKKETGKK